MDNYSRKFDNALSLICAVSLFIAIIDLPYGYYIFLRVFIMVSSVYLFLIKRQTKDILTVISIIIIVLFNPFVHVFFTKGIWRFIDAFAGMFFLYFLIVNQE